MDSLGRQDFGVLVERFGNPRPLPFAVPGVEQVMNTLEFLVHHEDLRRASPPGSRATCATTTRRRSGSTCR
jgi:hypothetical protein